VVDVLAAIRGRHSVGRLFEPAPDDEQLRTILEAAVCAPDHESLRPWRFFVLRGAAKDAFGAVLADAYLARCEDLGTRPTEGQLNKEQTKLGRAPLVVVAAAVKQETTVVPWIEQQLAVGAAVENALLAAEALGFDSMWRTGDPAYGHRVKSALGLAPDDAIIAFLYLGTRSDAVDGPPHAPSLDGVVTTWEPR
jgi:nitroreductase